MWRQPAGGQTTIAKRRTLSIRRRSRFVAIDNSYGVGRHPRTGRGYRAGGQKLGQALAQHRGRSVHAAGTLCVDRWNGTERVQLRLIDIAAADAL